MDDKQFILLLLVSSEGSNFNLVEYDKMHMHSLNLISSSGLVTDVRLSVRQTV